MIIDARTLPAGTEIQTDVCVIGGGAVGITLAHELRDSHLDVCLLESGGLKFDREVQQLAGGEATGIPYFELAEARFRMLGGSTYRWGARGAPLKDIDFQERSWMPDSGWPISRSDLDPYYDRVHPLVGWHEPFHYDERIWESFSLRPPRFSPEQLEYCAFQFGKILLFGHHYRPALERAKNVKVVVHANVLNLQCDSSGTHLEFADVATLSGVRARVRARTFVLAAGGVENPRLLLLSNTVHPQGLCNDHDLVGRFFMEHPTATVGQVSARDLQEVHDFFSPGLIGRRLVEVGVALSPQVQASAECCNAYARTRPVLGRDATQAVREILGSLERRSTPKELWRQLGLALGDPVGLLTNVYRHVLGRPKRFRIDALDLEVRIEQEPNPDSRVTLSESTDPLGLRRVHLHWALTERDRNTMQVMAEVVGREFKRLGLGELRPESWITAREQVWSDGMVGGHHHLGTTRMSEEPQSGIVDRNCRAHAIDNLYIMGGSVFPTAGYVNPTPTILALTIRLADHLASLRPTAPNLRAALA